MTDLLIKSTVAMGVLLGLYHLLLEKEKMHRFNRFFLLGALLFSLILPFITVITYIQEIPQSDIAPTITSLPATVTVIEEQPVDYLFYTGWGIYLIVTLFLTIRFIKNIVHFYRKAKANPMVKMEEAKVVLLDEKVLPHTFLNYIFISREEYEANRIENELYTHELTHVKQKHTLDILFTEALKTIFWFNPLLYFYKKAIQLNHEFLADEKVIDSTANTIYYQNLLLEKAAVGTALSMASNLTFSLTKKRFVMMTKTTSVTKASLLKLAIVPVITIMMVLLCTETIAQTKDEAKLQSIYGKTKFKYTDKQGKTTEKKLSELSPEEKKDLATDLDPSTKIDLVEFNYTSKEEMAKKDQMEHSSAEAVSGDKVYTIGETSFPPSYNRGPYAFVTYISKNFKIPEELKDKENLVVGFSFVIEKDGSVSNVKITDDEGYGTAELMTDVLEKSEKWIPAKKEDETVRSLVALSLSFNVK